MTFLRATTVALIPLLVAGTTGCLAGNYRVSRDELMRLASTAPDQRWTAIRAVQSMGGGDTPPDGTGYGTGGGSYVPLVVPNGVWVGSRQVPSAPAYPVTGSTGPATGATSGGHGGGGSTGNLNGSAVVAVVVASAVVVFILAGTEGARYDGWVAVNPNEWVFLDQGPQTVAVPLAALTPDMVLGSDGGRLYEGPQPRFQRLGRAPLNRQGFTLQAGALMGGVPGAGGGVGSLGGGARMFAGGFPVHTVGLGLSADFLYGDSLYTTVGGEAQLMPLDFLGVYLGGGYASWGANGTSGGWYIRVGGQVEIPFTTRLALQLRAGFTRLDLGGLYGTGYTGEGSVGLAVY